MMKVQLNSEELREVIKILEKYLTLGEVWAFGSRSRTAPVKKFSDLDLAYFGDQKLSLKQLGLIQDAFSESDLNIKVELCNFDDLPPKLQEQVLQDRIRIYQARP